MSKLLPFTNRRPPGFEPKYRCIEPSDEYAGVLACVSMITGSPLAEVRKAALVTFNAPVQTQGIEDRPFAAELLVHFGSWKGGGLEVINPSRTLPDLAIVVTAAVSDKEVGGRHCLFHRQRQAPGQPGVEYVVDPSGIAPDELTRFDMGAMAFTHYMHVYWMEFSDDF